MSDSTRKRRKRYVYHPNDRTKHTYLIHFPGHSSDECKVFGDFGSKHAKIRPTKDQGRDPTNIRKFNRQQEKNFS